MLRQSSRLSSSLRASRPALGLHPTSQGSPSPAPLLRAAAPPAPPPFQHRPLPRGSALALLARDARDRAARTTPSKRRAGPRPPLRSSTPPAASSPDVRRRSRSAETLPRPAPSLDRPRSGSSPQSPLL